nr:hypothetical protein [Calidithermus roseus]
MVVKLVGLPVLRKNPLVELFGGAVAALAGLEFGQVEQRQRVVQRDAQGFLQQAPSQPCLPMPQVIAPQQAARAGGAIEVVGLLERDGLPEVGEGLGVLALGQPHQGPLDQVARRGVLGHELLGDALSGLEPPLRQVHRGQEGAGRRVAAPLLQDLTGDPCGAAEVVLGLGDLGQHQQGTGVEEGQGLE